MIFPVESHASTFVLFTKSSALLEQCVSVVWWSYMVCIFRQKDFSWRWNKNIFPCLYWAFRGVFGVSTRADWWEAGRVFSVKRDKNSGNSWMLWTDEGMEKSWFILINGRFPVSAIFFLRAVHDSRQLNRQWGMEFFDNEPLLICQWLFLLKWNPGFVKSVSVWQSAWTEGRPLSP